MNSLIQNCDWEITTHCNLNCKHCLINHHPKRELSTKECFLVIDILKRLGCKQINFTGGEALVKKDFLKILEYTSKKGISANLFTNGTNTSETNMKVIKKFVDYIGVSLEGNNANNNLVRGLNSYNKTIKTLKLLKRYEIPFGIYLTLNKMNIKSLKQILLKIKKIDPTNISLNELVLRGRARKNRKELYLKLNKEEIFQTIKEVFPKENLKLEKGCNINPKKIFLTSEGKFYFCTEIRQCKRSMSLGSFIPTKLHKFTKFLKEFSKRKKEKSCPYVSYSSNKITLNFLTGEKCQYIK